MHRLRVIGRWNKLKNGLLRIYEKTYVMEINCRWARLSRLIVQRDNNKQSK